jgi:hypothetical protein
VDSFAGTILAFAYIVIDRLVIDLGIGIVIEGIVSTDGRLVFGAVLVAVIEVFLFVSDLDIALFTAFNFAFLILLALFVFLFGLV